MLNIISYLKTISLISFLTIGCGRYEVPKTEIVESKGECGEKRTCTSEKEEPEVDTVETSEEDPEIETEEAEEETDTVEASEEEEEDKLFDLDNYIFVPKSKSWAQHKEDAPEGYRLVLRSEAIYALEIGVLDELMDDKVSFWTASENEGLLEMAWVMSFTSNYSIPKTVAFPALFIAK